MSLKLMSHGTMFDLLNPTPEMINMDEIAHSLDHTCRFGGACSQFYSVAEHSMAGAFIAYEDALIGDHGLHDLYRLNLAKAFLLHDAAEAYIGDIPTPVKILLGDQVLDMESRIMDCIYKKLWPEYFGLSEGDLASLQADVKRIDVIMLSIERNFLMPEHKDWVMHLPTLKKGTVSAAWMSNRFLVGDVMPGNRADGFKRFYHQLFVDGKLTG